MVLFFGCRESTKDDIYKKELEECLSNGALDEVYKAYSRELNKPKVVYKILFYKICIKHICSFR